MGFVSNTTATTLTTVAKPEHAAQNNTRCAIFQVYNSRRTNSCFQSSSASFRLNFSPIKAMAKAAETLSVQPGSGSSAAGSKQALISLSDKEDLALLGNGLQELGYTVVSTGGTASALESAGVSVTKVEEITSFPEMLDGRVKTLHPNMHGGILARRDQNDHMEALDKHGIDIGSNTLRNQ